MTHRPLLLWILLMSSVAASWGCSKARAAEERQLCGWLNVGLGSLCSLSPIGDNGGAALCYSLCVSRSRMVLTARFFSPLGGSSGAMGSMGSPSAGYPHETGILVGRRWTRRNSWQLLSVGLSSVQGYLPDRLRYKVTGTRSREFRDTSRTMGLALEATIARSGRFVGVGGGLVADVNTHGSFVALLLLLHGGLIRR